jgi:hypothetical protein
MLLGIFLPLPAQNRPYETAFRNPVGGIARFRSHVSPESRINIGAGACDSILKIPSEKTDAG